METKKVREISYENWLSSAQKWVEILKRVKNKEIFNCVKGFKGLSVATACGYCRSFGYHDCSKCPLFLKKRSYSDATTSRKIPICFVSVAETYLWFFIDEMIKDNPDFKIAEYRCKVILGAILEDCPDKEKAIKDGIIFNF